MTTTGTPVEELALEAEAHIIAIQQIISQLTDIEEGATALKRVRSRLRKHTAEDRAQEEASFHRNTPRYGLTPMARSAIEVADGISIGAVVLPMSVKSHKNVFRMVDAGDIYYVPSWKQFAFRVGPCVLHANLGNISQGMPPKTAGPIKRRTLTRIKNCHRRMCSGHVHDAKCQYYHDPEDYPSSSDTRNYIADAWCYTPSTSPARYGTRRIGSVEFLRSDLSAISYADARRFLDQTAHDIICSLILWQHVIAPVRRR